MRLVHIGNISAPSSSLLRFLRSQAENVCFFTPATSGLTSTLCVRKLRRTMQHFRKSTAKQTRDLSTTSRRSAAVESSLLHLKFWEQQPKQDIDFGSSLSCLRRPIRSIKRSLLCSSSTHRFSSNDTRPLYQKLWTSQQQKAGNNLKDWPQFPRYLNDGHGPALGFSAGKVSNELKLRCTEFDENGNVTLVNGEFKKSELIAKVRRFIELSISENSH